VTGAPILVSVLVLISPDLFAGGTVMDGRVLENGTPQLCIKMGSSTCDVEATWRDVHPFGFALFETKAFALLMLVAAVGGLALAQEFKFKWLPIAKAAYREELDRKNDTQQKNGD